MSNILKIFDKGDPQDKLINICFTVNLTELNGHSLSPIMDIVTQEIRTILERRIIQEANK